MLIKQCFDSVYHHVSSIWSCCHAMSQDQWRQWSFPYFLTRQAFQLSWNQCAQSVITTMAFLGPQWQCVLHSLCFCRIWTLCVVYHVQPLTLCPIHSLLSALVPAMFNSTSNAQRLDCNKSIVMIPRDHIVFMITSWIVDCKF